MIKIFFTIISSLLITATAVAQEPLLATALSRDSIMIGEQVQWTFRATVPSAQQVYFAQLDSIAGGLIEVLDITPPDTVQRESKHVTVEMTLRLTSFDAGIYTLSGVPALWMHGGQTDTLFFEPVTLKVATIAIDTATFQAFDIKPPVRYPLTLREILWPWSVAGLGVAALVAALVYIIGRLRKKQPVFGKIRPADPPDVVALRELAKIKDEKLWQNNKVKLYYTRVTDVLRVYLEQRYAIQAPEQTSDEILQALAQLPLPDYFIPKLREFLSTSDLVKFAKYLPAMEENESALILVTQFVDETKEQTEKETTD
ncbi:MAG: hypothetical protein LBD91_00970 [Prevotellaceae bacterium]|jgi:hypothetical protein|nr:hypothetical protein [Prevotellaceae bacterium]